MYANARDRDRRAKRRGVERRCPVEGCNGIPKKGYALCFTCWQEVPRYLRLEVHTAREAKEQAMKSDDGDVRLAGIRRYAAAVDAAVRAVEDPL